jgi:P-type E1-E2 ATPase
VVGDVCFIEEGMSIPCDGFVIKAIEVSTDESAMTGETDAIKKGTMEMCNASKESTGRRIDYEESISTKKIPSPVLLSGTKIMSGEGFFVVIVVGVNSCAGKIRSKLTDDEAEDGTPL